ncbi:hypothetical protein PRK78_006433 [Emydomyces testavorans]|uniref:Aminoglycoside phosphotransferase domain-containing protein n=1 Tax=Emydomyces testavorans TaxID=2070801 RepID=A0AAF0DLE7_9EURO|nr:hypothetical protein PRK78_006433 [Emydomyces testavorans]
MPSPMPQSSESEESLFQNTSRRWIYNETLRLKERYVRFNIPELMQVATAAANTRHCVRIEKLAEGGFNKIFLLTMDNEYEVIARIPTPIAGPPHYTTASEVATMDFLRNILEIPVPRVLAYCSTADNPVGAEYIIMERLRGESLASRFLELPTNKVKGLMMQLVGMEEKIFSYNFPAYGSLYYANDVPESLSVPLPNEKWFCIGPISKRAFWFDERQDMDVDRGPWTTPQDAITAAARRESLWLAKFAKPQRRQTFSLSTEEPLNPTEHDSLLNKYLMISPFLIPKDEDLCKPILRHPDLSLGNIILVPDSNKVLSLIDWQDAAILPLFMQAGYPAFCEHELAIPQSMKPPELPEEFDNLSDTDKQQVWAGHRLEEANLYYNAATQLGNKLHFKAFQMPSIGLLQYLISQSGMPWDADFINLKMSLVHVSQSWDKFSAEDCPILFTPEEQKKALDDATEWNESAAILTQMRDGMGIDIEGGTEPENLEFAMHINQGLRTETVRHSEKHERELAWRTWPFKDDDDTSPMPDVDSVEP